MISLLPRVPSLAPGSPCVPRPEPGLQIAVDKPQLCVQSTLACPTCRYLCLVLRWDADGYGQRAVLKLKGLLIFSDQFLDSAKVWWCFCPAKQGPFVSFSWLMLLPPLPSQATTLMELWNHLTSTLASWKSTSARRTHQICKCFPCSAAGAVFAVVFGGEVLSNFQPCNSRNHLEITVHPGCASVPPRVLLYCSLLPYLFPVLPPASSSCLFLASCL